MAVRLTTQDNRMKSIILLLSFFSFLSCDYFIDRALYTDESYVSPYSGIWVGKYVGNEIGDLSIDVAKNGTTSITRTSEYNNETTFFSGMIRDDGALQSVVFDSGFTLNGNFLTKSGTWKFGQLNGTWSVIKK